MNTFYHGDCLFVMNHDIEANSIDLIYLDPPFFTGKVQKGTTKWRPEAMEVSYEDSKKFWGDTEKVNAMRTKSPEWLRHIAQTRPDFASYLFYMMERLEACHKVLNDKGSIYLHCDEKASHYLKMIMDEPDMFGVDNFRNEIVWRRMTGAKGNATSRFSNSHDIILFYTKSKKAKFIPSYTPLSANYIKAFYRYKDTDGRLYRKAGGSRPSHYKYYLDESKGTPVQDIWTDIINVQSGKEDTGYPTQKPLALLERIIKASSKEGDTILDPFCGCGTAIIAAQKLGRHWIGIDISKDAYNVSKDRYHQLSFESQFGQPEPQYIERLLSDVEAIDKPSDFEKWVNGYLKATKPRPDEGIDSITPDGIPIQTKTFVVNSKWVRSLFGDAILHPQVQKPCKQVILVSQKDFDDSARREQFKIQTKEGIKVELLIPSMMLEGDGIR